jgi:hypothetical protein
MGGGAGARGLGLGLGLGLRVSTHLGLAEPGLKHDQQVRRPPTSKQIGEGGRVTSHELHNG